MTDAAKSFHPPWAVTAWVDGNYIYLEIPATDNGAPYIFKESLTEGGLSKALHLMADARKKAKPAQVGSYNLIAATGAKVMIAKRTANGLKKSQFTEEQRQAASEVLKKLGITGKGK